MMLARKRQVPQRFQRCRGAFVSVGCHKVVAMTEPLRRRPEDLNAAERLALAMGRPVLNPPTEEEMRAYYAKLRRAKDEAERLNGGPPRPGRAATASFVVPAPPDAGLKAVERLAEAMG